MLAVTVVLVRRRPVGALLLAITAWQVGFLSRAAVDSTLGTVVLAAGLIATGFLAGRHASAGHRGVAVLVLATAGAVTAALVVTGGVDTAIASAAATAVFVVVPWSVGRYRRRYVEMVEAGWDRAEQWERDADHAARAGVTRAAERLADAVRLLRTEQDEPVESTEEVVDRARRSGLLVDLVTDGAGQPEPVIARTVHRVLVGGRFDAHPRPDGGFEVTASLPDKDLRTPPRRPPAPLPRADRVRGGRRAASADPRRQPRHRSTP